MSADSMASGWYYLKQGIAAGQQAGPYGWQQLCFLAETGEIDPDDLVWNQQLPDWVAASQVPGLIARAAGPAAMAAGGRPTIAATGRRSRLVSVLVPLIALIVVGGGLGVYFGVLRDGSDDGKGGTGSTVDGLTLTSTTTAMGDSTASTGGSIDDTTVGGSTTTGGVASTTSTTGGGGSTSTTAPMARNTWTYLSPAGGRPSSRERAAMVYDPSRGEAILFGGWHGGCLGETWAYDPLANSWTDLNPSGEVPSQRMGHSMVYDPASGRVILFGGHSGTADLNDTWAHDPAANAWTQLSPGGELPPPRSLHSMTYDPGQSRMILFGGWNGAVLDDLWAYDPATNNWKELKPSRAKPPARSGQSMVYEPDTGTMILFGGVNSNTHTLFNDTWAYTPKANVWNQLDPSGGLPAARGAASMAYDPGKGALILFGGGVEGVDGGDFNDTWAYDPAAKTWTDLSPAGDAPSVRWGSAIFYDPAGERLVIFGGMGEFTYFDETWAYRP